MPPGNLAAVRRAVHGNRFYRWPHTRVGQWLLAAHNVAYEQRTRIRRVETKRTHVHRDSAVSVCVYACECALLDIAIATLTTCAHAPPA